MKSAKIEESTNLKFEVKHGREIDETTADLQNGRRSMPDNHYFINSSFTLRRNTIKLKRSPLQRTSQIHAGLRIQSYFYFLFSLCLNSKELMINSRKSRKQYQHVNGFSLESSTKKLKWSKLLLSGCQHYCNKINCRPKQQFQQICSANRMRIFF